MAVQRRQREEPKRERDMEAHGEHGMIPVTRKVHRSHLSPVPGAAEPLPNPFPAVLHQGLILGIAIGAAVGLLVAYLLFNGVVAIPGWEGLFSMGPFTFHFFWMMMGVALGIVLVGVGTLLVVGPAATQNVEDVVEEKKRQ